MLDIALWGAIVLDDPRRPVGGGSLPAEGTDCRRLLDALIAAAPEPVWSPNSLLELTAHSRVPELRKLGWTIESVSRRPDDTVRVRKRQFGYRLVPS